MAIDLNDLRNLNICKTCRKVFMPTEEELNSWLLTTYCKECKKCKNNVFD